MKRQKILINLIILLVAIFFAYQVFSYIKIEDDKEKSSEIYRQLDRNSLKKDNKDLTSYQLTSSILNRLNIDNGVLNKFHNQFKDSEDYLDDLKLLQYDMLYGQKYIYGGENPFIATDLKMGTYDIIITNVYEEDGNLIVKGENFNKYSKIYINNQYTKTTFIDQNTIMANNTTVENESSIVVTQRTSGGGKLSSTNIFTYPIDDGEVIQFQ